MKWKGIWIDRNLGHLSGYETYEDEQKTPSKKTKEAKMAAKETKNKAAATSTATATAAATSATTTSTTTATSTNTTTLAAEELPQDSPAKVATVPESKPTAPHTPTKVEKPTNICEESNDSKYSKETKETNTDTTTTTTSTSSGSSSTTNSTKDAKDSSRPTSSSVVIVQDTDVTITGVYVNSTTGSSQEAYCKMQYRVQSSVTEERLVRPGSTEPPPKSYTPLSALSSMLPPGATAAGVVGEGELNLLFL